MMTLKQASVSVVRKRQCQRNRSVGAWRQNLLGSGWTLYCLPQKYRLQEACKLLSQKLRSCVKAEHRAFKVAFDSQPHGH